MRAKHLVALSVLVLFIAGCLAIRPAKAASRYGANFFPNIELTDQNGKKVHFYDDLIKGKTIALTFIYTQCKDACPLETARMRQVQKALGDRVGKDIFFVSVSIDPTHDTPEALHDYAEMYNAGPGWSFLTGNPDEILALTKRLGMWEPPDPAFRDGHAPSLLIGNEPTGQWMHQGAGDNPQFLALQIERLTGYNNVSSKKLVSYEEANKLRENFDKGRYLFTKTCAPCHTIGHGDLVGPDLQGVTNVRDPKWLKEFITAPDKKIFDEKDPIAVALYEHYKHVRMPNLALIPEDVDTLIKFLKTQTGAPADKPAGTPQADASHEMHHEGMAAKN
jgi:protein SCO1/2